MRSGLKGRRNPAQGESLGASKTSSTRGLKGRRNPAQGESLGVSNAPPIIRGLSGRRRESLGASKVSSTRDVKGRQNPLAPVATPVTVRNSAQDWDRPPPALQAGWLWPVARTQGFSLGWVPAALQAAGGSRALLQTG